MYKTNYDIAKIIPKFQNFNFLDKKLYDYRQ